MSNFLSWLKRMARKWCAPRYDDMSEKIEDLGVALIAMDKRLTAATEKNVELLEVNNRFRSYFDKQQNQKGFPVVTADDAPKWDGPDADRWRHYLATETGQKLQALANYHEQSANRSAVLRVQGAENNTGFARGWHKATAYFFQTLSAMVPPQTDQEDKQPGDGASQLLERVAP